jgi:hypothetical protein
VIRTRPSRPAFTTTIKDYTYTLTPRATYDIAGLVVSQHRGDALFNLYHQADPGNIRDVCVVWGGALTPAFNPEKGVEQSRAMARATSCTSRIYPLWRRASTCKRMPDDIWWYTSLALFVALGFVWFVRRPVAE